MTTPNNNPSFYQDPVALNQVRILFFVLFTPLAIFFIALTSWMLYSKDRRHLNPLIIASCLMSITSIANIVYWQLCYTYAN